MRVELLSFGVVVLAIAGCGGVTQSDLFGDGSTSPDGGAPGKDGGGVVILPGDARADGAKTALPDAGVAPDSTTYVPPDGSTTPVPEAAPPVDTGTPTTTPVQCANGPCSTATPVCCISVSQQGESGTCTASAADCSGQGNIPVSCESQSACSGGVCCASLAMFDGQTYPTAIACSPSCNGNDEAPLCAVGGNDCQAGQNCNGFNGAPFGVCQGF